MKVIGHRLGGLTGTVIALATASLAIAQEPPDRSGPRPRDREERRPMRPGNGGPRGFAADPETEQWIQDLATRLTSGNELIRRSARQGLFAIGPVALDSLRRIADGPDSALAEAVRPLIERIQHGPPDGMNRRPGGRGPGPGGMGPGPSGMGPGAGGMDPRGGEMHPGPGRRGGQGRPPQNDDGFDGRPAGDQGADRAPGGFPPRDGQMDRDNGAPGRRHPQDDGLRAPRGRSEGPQGPPPDGGPRGPRGGPPERAIRHFEHVMDNLGLNDEQRAQIDQIRRDHQGRVVELMQHARDGALDRDALRTAHERLHGELMDQLRGVLSEDQFEAAQRALPRPVPQPPLRAPSPDSDPGGR